MPFVRSNVGLNDLDPYEITVTSTDQILNGYKDYNSNGDLITGSNLGYDAGVTQGHTDRDTGVTVTSGSQVISGYKARTSDGTLVTGSDAGYSAGVVQGHADRDTGVTVTAASHIISGYKARNSSGTLLTGTDKGYSAGYNAGVTKGESNMKSGVTVTAANQIVSGYKARNSSGTLLTGTATSAPTYSTQTKTVTAPSTKDRWNTTSVTFTFPNKCLGTQSFSMEYPYRIYSISYGGTKNNTCTISLDTADRQGYTFSITAIGY